MENKFVSIVRKTERFILQGSVKVGRAIAKFFVVLWAKVYPGWHKYAKRILLAIVVLYVIGGVVFGVRLYRQKRFEKIDRLASNIYPFPVAHAGRSIIFARGLEYKVYWAKNFASKMQIAVPEDVDKSILDDMVSDALIMQEAGRLKVTVTQKDLDDAFNQAVGGIGGEEQAISFIQENYGMSLTQFKNLILPKVALSKIRDGHFVSVKAQGILIADENKAKDILGKIKAGGDFAQLAKENSEDQASKDNGGYFASGDFVFKELSGLPAEVENALFELKVGEVSELVKSGLGFHILKVDEKRGTIEQKPSEWLELIKTTYPTKNYIS